MKVALLSPALAAYTLLLFALLSSDKVSAIAGSPVNGSDVMATEKMANREACRRLCWYRELCTSFSFCSACQGDINCLLHSSHLEDDGTPKPQDAAWEEEVASPPSPDHVCALRHCGPDRTCVPVARGAPLCVPQPALCDLAAAPPGSRLNASGTPGAFGLQGQVTQVQCLPDYVLVPPDADVNVSCQVNSKWTRFKGQCLRVVYTNPEIPLVAPLPWPIRSGSGLCVRGRYGSQSISKIALAPSGCDTMFKCEDDILFRLVTRLWTLSNGRASGLFWRQNRGSTMHFLHSGNLTSQTGDEVAYSFEFLKATIRVSIQSRRERYRYDIGTSGAGYVINLAKATHLLLVGSLSLSYVNIVETCRVIE